MNIRNVVTLKEVSDDLNDGKAFYDQKEAGRSLVPVEVHPLLSPFLKGGRGGDFSGSSIARKKSP